MYRPKTPFDLKRLPVAPYGYITYGSRTLNVNESEYNRFRDLLIGDYPNRISIMMRRFESWERASRIQQKQRLKDKGYKPGGKVDYSFTLSKTESTNLRSNLSPYRE